MIDPAPGGRPRALGKRAMLRALAAAGLAAAGAVVVPSCNLVIGAGNYKVGDAGACSPGECACGGFAFTAAACGTCVGDKCCDQATACRDDATCATFYDCTAACKDAHCRNQCAVKHPVGDDAAAKALEVCLSQSKTCGNACSPCGGLGDWYADTCSACLQQKCCAKAKACADDDVCAERQRCYRACTYPSCPIECDAKIAAAAVLPSTSDAIAGLDTCLSNGCGKQCGYGAHWDCVGNFNWPSGAGGKVTLTVRTISFLTDMPLPHVPINVCLRNDYPCNDVQQTVTSDDKGIAEIELDSGFDGYLDVVDPADGVMESLVYFTWPVVAPSTYDLLLGPYDVYKSLVINGGGSVLDDKGAIFAFAEDCLGAGAAGVTFDVTPKHEADSFYFLNGSPVDGQIATNSDAIGGYANVDVGTATFTAARLDNGQEVAAIPVQVRMQAITYVSITPTPTP